VKPARVQAPSVVDSGPKATALYFDTRLTAAPRDEDERLKAHQHGCQGSDSMLHGICG